MKKQFCGNYEQILSFIRRNTAINMFKFNDYIKYLIYDLYFNRIPSPIFIIEGKIIIKIDIKGKESTNLENTEFVCEIEKIFK